MKRESASPGKGAHLTRGRKDRVLWVGCWLPGCADIAEGAESEGESEKREAEREVKGSAGTWSRGETKGINTGQG